MSEESRPKIYQPLVYDYTDTHLYIISVALALPLIIKKSFWVTHQSRKWKRRHEVKDYVVQPHKLHLEKGRGGWCHSDSYMIEKEGVLLVELTRWKRRAGHSYAIFPDVVLANQRVGCSECRHHHLHTWERNVKSADVLRCVRGVRPWWWHKWALVRKPFVTSVTQVCACVNQW